VELANQNAAVLAREEEIRREGGGEVAYARAVALGEVLGLAAAPERIEGFDVSNIQGREPVGSMVVFIGGRPAPEAYRRFKVQTKETPDDYAMMQEILYRRFRRLREAGKVAETPGEYAAAPAEPAGADRLGPAPDLILIDGGKGHLTVALEVLGDLGIDVPVLALAKEEEMVFLPGRPEPLGLPLNSPASHLLRHVRDEAHRFAVGYHRLLRRKKARQSELDDIPGVGPARRTALLRAFGTTKKIRAASAEELAAVPEIGKAAAKRIWEYLHGAAPAPLPPIPHRDGDLARVTGGGREEQTGLAGGRELPE
jgi:excinuclease ABC subunit C